jgi:hypothetical protein
MFNVKLVPDKRLGDIVRNTWLENKDKIELPLEKKYWGKTGRVYYLRLEYNGMTLYKLGYTGKPVKERIRTLDIPTYVKVTLLELATCKKAAHALGVELYLHSLYSEDRYKGFWFLKSGNTEIYKRDILGLDRGQTKYIDSPGVWWAGKEYKD